MFQWACYAKQENGGGEIKKRKKKTILCATCCERVPIPGTVFSPGWAFTGGTMMARERDKGLDVSTKLGRCLGLRELLVEESESCESWTVTQLMTLDRWGAPQLQQKVSAVQRSL